MPPRRARPARLMWLRSKRSWTPPCPAAERPPSSLGGWKPAEPCISDRASSRGRQAEWPRPTSRHAEGQARLRGARKVNGREDPATTSLFGGTAARVQRDAGFFVGACAAVEQGLFQLSR